MTANLMGFTIAIALILAGILFNRQDSKVLRAEIRGLGNDVNREIGNLRSEIGNLRSDVNREIGDLRNDFTRLREDMAQFYRTIGQHDAKIEHLEKRA